ncbi:MAG TPA: hypothetical protein VF618_28730 [Thermoanaerobaculia bacterium]
MSINEPNAGDAGGSTTGSRIRDKAAGLADGAKQQASHFYDNKKSALVSEIGNLASILRQAGESGDAGFTGRLASVAAERVERFASTADGKELDDLLQDLESFARRNPAVFVGSAMAIGFLASRFIKSSARGLATAGRDVEGHYSNEAYGGYRSGRTDSAIGSSGSVGSGMGGSMSGAATGSTTGATGTSSSNLGTSGTTSGNLGGSGIDKTTGNLGSSGTGKSGTGTSGTGNSGSNGGWGSGGAL